MPTVELKLAEDGEILVRGPMIMKGYRNMPEKTAEALSDDGWLSTGDIGQIDDEGYLKIVDRKKELIINSGGKNMSPANIEAKIKAACPLVAQVVAIGDNRPYNVALITLDPDACGAFARSTASPTPRPRDGARGGRREAVEAGVAKGNEALAHRADQEVRADRRRMGAGRRGADPDVEAQAQADRREVRRRNRRALHGVGERLDCAATKSRGARMVRAEITPLEPVG